MSKVWDSDPEITDSEFRHPIGKGRINVQNLIRRVRLETEHRLQKREDRPGSPTLWHVGAKILDRKVRIVPLGAGIEFRHLIHGEIVRRPRDRFCDAARLIVETVAFHALRDESIVVRPDRAGSCLIIPVQNLILEELFLACAARIVEDTLQCLGVNRKIIQIKI